MNKNKVDRKKNFVSSIGTHNKKQLSARKAINRKFVLAFVAVVSSIAMLTIGVVATTTNMLVEFSNGIHLNVDKVEGTLTASRTGGVYALGPNIGTNASSITDLEIYNTDDGKNTNNYNNLVNEKINLSPTRSQIDYVFKFIADVAETNTRISLTYTAISEPSALTSTYKYYLGANAPNNWSEEGVVAFENDTDIVVGQSTVFILARLTLDVSEDVVVSAKSWEFNLDFSGTTDIATVSGGQRSAPMVQNANTLYEVEFGTFPQTFVGSAKNTQMETAYLEGELTLSGSYQMGDGTYSAYTTDQNKTYVRVPTINPYSTEYVLSDRSTTANAGAYWFEVEPIKWLILNADSNNYESILAGETSAILMCKSVIFANKFHNTIMIPEANRWSGSSVQVMLNGTNNADINASFDEDDCFYSQVFSNSEKEQISTHQNDNCESTDIKESVENGDAPTTYDKVWLLSYLEIEEYMDTAIKRFASTTDFAIASGVGLLDNYSSAYWLRSPSMTTVNSIYVDASGNFQVENVNEDWIGVRPTIEVTLSND